MAQPAGTSGFLTLAGKPRSERRPWAGPVDYRKPVKGQRTLATVSVPLLPVNAAEVAQARAFERLLQAECAELHELARRMAGPEEQQPDSDSSLSAVDLMQIRARIDEVDRLVRGLRGRFPHA